MGFFCNGYTELVFLCNGTDRDEIREKLETSIEHLLRTEAAHKIKTHM